MRPRRRPSRAVLLSMFGCLMLATCGEGHGAGSDDFVIEHVTVIPMTADVVLEDHTVVVRDGLISAVGPEADVQASPGATTIDGTGTFLVPGLADLHIHSRDDWFEPVWPVPPSDLFLAHGVTTVRDLGPRGSTSTYVLDWRDRIAAGTLAGPRLLASDVPLGSSSDLSACLGPLSVAERVAQTAADGFDAVKVYSFLTPDQFDEVMTAADEHGLYVIGHPPLAVGVGASVAAGLDEIAHVEELEFELLAIDRTLERTADEWYEDLGPELADLYESIVPMDDDAIDAVIESRLGPLLAVLPAGFPVSTTLTTSAALAALLDGATDHDVRGALRYEATGPIGSVLPCRDQPVVTAADLAGAKLRLDLRLAAALHRAGARLVLGTDAGTGDLGIVPGFSVLDELELLVDAGLSPYEALVTATRNAGDVIARMTGRRDAGRIEVGMRADLVLLAADPRHDLDTVASPLGVLTGGTWYDTAALTDLLRLRS